MDLNNPNIPIITPKPPHQDQKLIVNFIRNEAGNECITISFEPEIPEVRSPAQAAAVNVANHIIRSFALNKPEVEPVDETPAPTPETPTPQGASDDEKKTG